MEVDHISMDKLDNRKANLRVCSTAENQCNRGLQRNNTSGLKGVTYYKANRKWGSSINKNKKKHFLGLFDTPEEAAEAYREASIELHGEYGRFN
jgi:hypothetical protein